MSKQTLPAEVRWAIEAAQDKKASEVTYLDLTGLGSFTDGFLLCTGQSTPQVQAIPMSRDITLSEFSDLNLRHRHAVLPNQ